MSTNGKQSSRRSNDDRQVVVHPVLFALNPIMFIYVESFAFVDAGAIVRATVVSLAAAALCWIVLRRWLDDVHKSALLTSLAFLLFFAYRAIVGTLGDLGWFPSTHWVPGAHVALLAAMCAVWYGVSALVRKYPIHSAWTYFANVAGTAAVIFPFLVAGKLTYEALVIQEGIEWKHESLPVAGDRATPEPPDIYWILPDTYARADILADFYDHDNQPFLDQLRRRGFTVAPKAVSNYSTTAVSVTSALNLDYFHNLMDGDIEHFFDWRLSRRLLSENRVVRFLNGRGYTTYSVAAPYDNINWRSDHRISRWWFTNQFEAVLLASTPVQSVSRLLGFPILHEHHRARTRFALDWVVQAPNLPGPKFVFVQLVTPHPPFLFGAEGEAVNPPWPYSQAEGLAFQWIQEGATKGDYLAGYRRQVRYINQRLVEAVSRIQAGSKRPPVIVVMSDHGPASGEWMSDLSRPEVIERFAILAALSLPGIPSDAVPADLNEVNTFRLILNHYFDTKLDLLESKAYYVIESQPYRYIPVDLTASFGPSTIPELPPPADSSPKGTSTSN